MLDRKVISKKYYRERMAKFGFEFPDDMEEQIVKEQEKEAELKALAAPPALQQNAQDAANGTRPPPPGPNNAARPNESGGTEADQTLERQASG